VATSPTGSDRGDPGPPEGTETRGVAGEASPAWTFLSNHGQVLVCIARDPATRLRDIALVVGITERATHRIVGQLDGDGYITRTRDGRRSRYTIARDMEVPEDVRPSESIGALLDRLIGSPS
jgi:hypothetical protein